MGSWHPSEERRPKQPYRGVPMTLANMRALTRPCFLVSP